MGPAAAVLAWLLRPLLAPQPPSRPDSDEELFAAYVGGDDRAFDDLFSRYAPALLTLMRKQVRKDEDARELVQQTFLHLHRARHDFRPGAALRPWLYTIALNLRREHFRRLGRRREEARELTDRELPRTEQPDIGRGETAQQVRAAIGRLPEGQQVVIHLHWFEGLPFSEVADVLGLSESAAKVRAHRGYKRLKQILADLDGGLDVAT
jgi:RNA polymerase sigma factor (sigma-70 family)